MNFPMHAPARVASMLCEAPDIKSFILHPRRYTKKIPKVQSDCRSGEKLRHS